MHFGFALELSDKDLWNIDLLDTPLDLLSPDKYADISSILFVSIISSRRLQDIFKNCNDLWLRTAEHVLRNNKLHPFVFAEALRTLIIKGQGKHRNVMVIDNANCGKTFLFCPMEKLFEVFCNPTEDKYPWVEVVYAEVIFLNNFRWCEEMISWKCYFF